LSSSFVERSSPAKNSNVSPNVNPFLTCATGTFSSQELLVQKSKDPFSKSGTVKFHSSRNSLKISKKRSLYKDFHFLAFSICFSIVFSLNVLVILFATSNLKFSEVSKSGESGTLVIYLSTRVGYTPSSITFFALAFTYFSPVPFTIC
jgi:hypothetical protein